MMEVSKSAAKGTGSVPYFRSATLTDPVRPYSNLKFINERIYKNKVTLVRFIID